MIYIVIVKLKEGMSYVTSDWNEHIKTFDKEQDALAYIRDNILNHKDAMFERAFEFDKINGKNKKLTVTLDERNLKLQFKKVAKS